MFEITEMGLLTLSQKIWQDIRFQLLPTSLRDFQEYLE